MTEMGIAPGAMHLCPRHKQRSVGLGFNRIVIAGLKETGPAGAGIEFVIGFEQRMSATNAIIRAGILAPIIFAAERPLGAMLARDVELLVG